GAWRRLGIVPRCGRRLAGRLLQGLADALALLAVGLLLAGTRGGVAGFRRRGGRRRRALAFGRCLRRGALVTAALRVIPRIRGVPAAGGRRVALLSLRRPVLLAIAVAPAVAIAAGGRLLPARGLDHLAVGDRVLHARCLRQGPVVGGQCLVVTPLPGQRVAEVVLGLGAACAGGGKGRGGGFEIPLAIGIHTLLQLLLRLLVGAPPGAVTGQRRR